MERISTQYIFRKRVDSANSNCKRDLKTLSIISFGIESFSNSIIDDFGIFVRRSFHYSNSDLVLLINFRPVEVSVEYRTKAQSSKKNDFNLFKNTISVKSTRE